MKNLKKMSDQYIHDEITDILIKLNTNKLPLSDVRTYKKYLANLRKVISDRANEIITK